MIRLVSRRAAFALVVSALAVAPLPAQGARRGAPVEMRVRPRVGDTITIRVEVTEDVTVSGRINDVDTTLASHSARVMYSRSVVLINDEDGSLLETIIDSVAMREGSGGALAPDVLTSRAVVGRSFRSRLTPQGAVTLLDGELMSPQVAAMFSAMPATLPATAVAVGESWSLTMSIPNPADAGAPGLLKTTFRLDSLAGASGVAFISVRGTLTRDEPARTRHKTGARADSAGMTGLVAGSMTFDRKRGWLTDTRTTVTVRGSMKAEPGGPGKPMRYQTKITWRATVVR